MLPLLPPMLAVSSQPFDSPEFLYEVKWDGYRALAYLDRNTTIRSRKLTDLTGKFPEFAGLHERVDRRPAVLDGEIVVFENGKPSFDRLQSRGRAAVIRSAPLHPAVFIAFDVLYAGGSPVLNRPLQERKDLLGRMVSPDGGISVSPYILKDGVDFFNACAGQGLEGAMAKNLAGAYLPGRRSPNWRKFRHTKEADLVICGYQPGRSGRGLGSLLLAGTRDGEFVYLGRVGTGFSGREAETLIERLQALAVDTPVVALPKGPTGSTRWVRPVLVCAVNYLTTTREGYLRHPVYRGLRFDKDPGECAIQAQTAVQESEAGLGRPDCLD